MFWQAKIGRYCCFCLQGLLRCHYRDMMAACGRLCCLCRRLWVRVSVTGQNPEPRTELVSCCLWLSYVSESFLVGGKRTVHVREVNGAVGIGL